jgi:hypothetical protein
MTTEEPTTSVSSTATASAEQRNEIASMILSGDCEASMCVAWKGAECYMNMDAPPEMIRFLFNQPTVTDYIMSEDSLPGDFRRVAAHLGKPTAVKPGKENIAVATLQQSRAQLEGVIGGEQWDSIQPQHQKLIMKYHGEIVSALNLVLESL